MLRLVASLCAPLPSVSENDRNSARIAITSAIRLLKNAACSPSWAFSIASLISDMMAPSRRTGVPFCQPLRRVQVSSSPRVGGAIGADQALGIDFGIDLRRRQRSVAEQLLDRAHVAAAGEQVRGEGVAQCVRRRRLWQAERAAQPRHGELNEARR